MSYRRATKSSSASSSTSSSSKKPFRRGSQGKGNGRIETGRQRYSFKEEAERRKHAWGGDDRERKSISKIDTSLSLSSSSSLSLSNTSQRPSVASPRLQQALDDLHSLKAVVTAQTSRPYTASGRKGERERENEEYSPSSSSLSPSLSLSRPQTATSSGGGNVDTVSSMRELVKKLYKKNSELMKEVASLKSERERERDREGMKEREEKREREERETSADYPLPSSSHSPSPLSTSLSPSPFSSTPRGPSTQHVFPPAHTKANSSPTDPLSLSLSPSLSSPTSHTTHTTHTTTPGDDFSRSQLHFLLSKKNEVISRLQSKILTLEQTITKLQEVAEEMGLPLSLSLSPSLEPSSPSPSSPSSPSPSLSSPRGPPSKKKKKKREREVLSRTLAARINTLRLRKQRELSSLVLDSKASSLSPETSLLVSALIVSTVDEYAVRKIQISSLQTRVLALESGNLMLKGERKYLREKVGKLNEMLVRKEEDITKLENRLASLFHKAHQ